MVFKTLFLALVSVFLFPHSGSCDDLHAGSYAEDTIFIQPIATPKVRQSVRVSVSVDPVKYDTNNGEVVLLPVEVMASLSGVKGQITLTRAKASILRWIFAYNIPVTAFTGYRDLDRGIESGFDLIGIRVPVFKTANGEFVVQPGLELGVRHYSAPVNTLAANASFIVEARAAAILVQNWLNTGIMAEMRYDLNVSEMSAFSAKGMGYLSLLLDRDHKLYARLYSGIDFQPKRPNVYVPGTDVDMPTSYFFTGVGIFGKF